MELVISIHAPVKGATPVRRRFLYSGPHFNPRTREGCDRPSDLQNVQLQHFNPRTREGCDAVAAAVLDVVAAISIHAPVKGATKRP